MATIAEHTVLRDIAAVVDTATDERADPNAPILKPMDAIYRIRDILARLQSPTKAKHLKGGIEPTRPPQLNSEAAE